MDSEEYKEWLNEEIGISDAFLERLKTDDDWTFIIKIHSMIEAALSQVIPAFFEKPDLHKIIARLETSNPKSGKVAFAKACGLLPSNAIVFIQYLSQLRNECAHNPKNFLFSIDSVFADLDNKQKEAWLNKVDFDLTHPLQRPEPKEKRRAVYMRKPRIGLHAGMIAVMSYLHCEAMKIRLEIGQESLDYLLKNPTKIRVRTGMHTPPKSNPKE